MDAGLLASAGCHFGGGTAIVLQNGEYRLSLDVDFLCADVVGYRILRSAATDRGAAAFFEPEVTVLRDIRADQYGIRALVAIEGQQVKFEIIREARIALSGQLDPALSISVLTPADQMAEKLLANADRGLDISACYRDALDLGILVHRHDAFLPEAVRKAEDAYGPDVGRKLRKVVEILAGGALVGAAEALRMERDAAVRALETLRRLDWPGSA